jgi:hypothetical protein
MRSSHGRTDESTVSPFWEITPSKHANPLDEGSWGDEFGDYEDSRELTEYWTEHSE